ncbi:BON domain-containing protein [Gayadomonas joobiniege]|uniref:BON domain-containing protein n=1 Tax=Gayadomonas joobiniege TaxID=1234606 RepID=UPI000366116A|nr:BON domain-containing protein [Gayadomonas joobiniege]
MQKSKLLLLVTLLVPILNGCAVALFGGAAATTAMVANDRRSLGAQIEDHEIEKNIEDWLAEDESIKGKYDVTIISFNRNVLLVGQADSVEVRNKILTAATRYPNFRDIFNEIRVSQKISAAQQTQDTWLTTKIKSRMLADKELDGHQVKVVTENGEVFLMGLLNEHEKKIALTIARNIDGVKNVVNVIEPYQNN